MTTSSTAAAGGEDRPLRDLVADALRFEITSGALPPGSRVREEQLALDHGVSRVPVREALQRLAGEGFLSLSPRRGATVNTPSAEKTLELMQIRGSLELLAVRRAADERGGAVASELVKVVKSGTRAAEAGQLRKLPALVDRFHALVTEASGNQELIVLLANVRSRVSWMFAVDLESRSTVSWSEHAGILEAVLAGDAKLAAQRMSAHVAHDEQLLRSRVADGTVPA